MKPLNASLRSAGRSLLSSSKNPFLPALYSALQSQSLGNYLAMVAHGSAGVGRPLQLSLDSCTLLQDLYIQYFRQSMPEITMAHIESSYAIHKAMLDDASCAALFCKLQKESTPTPSDLALLWYCWSQSPDRQLPFWALPPASSGPIFVAALNTGGKGGNNFGNNTVVYCLSIKTLLNISKDTTSTARGGGGSFKGRKLIGEVWLL